MLKCASVAEHVKLSYWINSSETIVRIAGPWDTWLGQDGDLSHRCQESQVIGSNLFSFIEGEGVQFVFHTMHARVFQTGKTIEFPFRCDSAWLRREMQMIISRDGDLLRYDSIITRETKRQHPLPQPTPGSNALIAMCSFCKAYRFPTKSPLWKDIESLFTEPDLSEPFSITHGICEPCTGL